MQLRKATNTEYTQYNSLRHMHEHMHQHLHTQLLADRVEHVHSHLYAHMHVRPCEHTHAHMLLIWLSICLRLCMTVLCANLHLREQIHEHSLSSNICIRDWHAAAQHARAMIKRNSLYAAKNVCTFHSNWQKQTSVAGAVYACCNALAKAHPGLRTIICMP